MSQADLIVGVSEIKPLVYKNGDVFSGFEIELWERIANNLGLKYQYKDYPFSVLLKKVASGEVDIALAGITETKEREEKFDFTHSSMNSSLLIMAPREKASLWGSIKNFFAVKYKKIVLAIFLLFLLIFLVANGIWLIERETGVFNESYRAGIFESLWWTVSTVTTVGYGDYVPISYLGRWVAVFVMLFGIMLFGIYSAELAAVITTAKLKHKIDTREDLFGKRVATKAGTVAETVLRQMRLDLITTKKIEQSYDLLKQGLVSAVVFDAPVLLNYCKNDKKKAFVLVNDMFYPQNYGFALPHGRQGLKEKINIEILRLRETGDFDEIYKKWFNQ